MLAAMLPRLVAGSGDRLGSYLFLHLTMRRSLYKYKYFGANYNTDANRFNGGEVAVRREDRSQVQLGGWGILRRFKETVSVLLYCSMSSTCPTLTEALLRPVLTVTFMCDKIRLQFSSVAIRFQPLVPSSNPVRLNMYSGSGNM